MMQELSKEHIEKLVVHFYDQVQKDELLGPIFNEIAKVDWNHHITLIVQFWNSIMLKTNEFHSSPYMKHVMLGKQVELTEAHFARWLILFQEEAFKYLPKAAAHQIVNRATLIANSLKLGTIKKDL